MQWINDSVNYNNLKITSAHWICSDILTVMVYFSCQIIPNSFLANPNTSATFATILVRFLLDRLDEMGSKLLFFKGQTSQESAFNLFFSNNFVLSWLLMVGWRRRWIFSLNMATKCYYTFQAVVLKIKVMSFLLLFSANMERSNLYLKLFKLVFGSVSLFASENEQMLKVSWMLCICIYTVKLK